MMNGLSLELLKTKRRGIWLVFAERLYSGAAPMSAMRVF